MALGAPQGELTRLFAAYGFVLALIGVVCGLVGSAALTRVLGSVLFDVSPLDPLTYAAVSVGLIVAAVTASYLPARRTMAVDPIQALRSE
jgi:putative ABC transport system permease protein